MKKITVNPSDQFKRIKFDKSGKWAFKVLEVREMEFPEETVKFYDCEDPYQNKWSFREASRIPDLEEGDLVAIISKGLTKIGKGRTLYDLEVYELDQGEWKNLQDKKTSLHKIGDELEQE